jgi:hypothetical protein
VRIGTGRRYRIDRLRVLPAAPRSQFNY